jgi:hypothetical protein
MLAAQILDFKIWSAHSYPQGFCFRCSRNGATIVIGFTFFTSYPFLLTSLWQKDVFYKNANL